MGNSSSKAAKAKDKRKKAAPSADEPPRSQRRQPVTSQQSQLRSQATQKSSVQRPPPARAQPTAPTAPTAVARSERPPRDRLERESTVAVRPSQLPAAAAHDDDKSLAESARLTAAKARALATGPSRPLFTHSPLFVGSHPAARAGIAQTKRVFDVSVVEVGGATTASEASEATLRTRGSTTTSALTLRPMTGESTERARPTASGLIFNWTDRMPLPKEKVDEVLQQLVAMHRVDAAALDDYKRRIYERARRHGRGDPNAQDIRYVVKH